MSLESSLQVVWEYLCQGRSPAGPVDVVVALGSHDPRVARHAADLILAGAAPLLVATGGRGKDTPVAWASEAHYYAEEAKAKGVPPSQIVLEPCATNTGENLSYTRILLARLGVPVEATLLVAKPYMQQRARATAAIQWPDVEHYTSAPDLSMHEYLADDSVDKAEALNLMAGDLQRMKVYADRGFQAPAHVPTEVWAAYEEVVAAGYDKYVLT